MIEIGLTALFREKQDLIKGRSVGLITNQTGVDGVLRDNVRLFAECANARLAALFSPEHGLWGNYQDALEVSSAIELRYRIPIHSLYGKTRKATREMLNGIDVLVFDMQDVGARVYTFISTMFLSMKAASRCDVDFIVLDRPNPIRGDQVEGIVLHPDFTSFVGSHSVPIRHGMTAGELALLFKADLDLELSLDVVPMCGWAREMWYDETGLQWVPPSPNMPTLDTAILYPGTCLIEGTNLSEGRGTTRPFEWIGAPWIDADVWVEMLNQVEMPGIRVRPVHFTPAFSKHANAVCHGVSLHIVDRDIVKPIELTLGLISTVLNKYPNHFEFHHTDRTYPFDFLAGTDSVRLGLANGKSPTALVRDWKSGVDEFSVRRKPYLIYG